MRNGVGLKYKSLYDEYKMSVAPPPHVNHLPLPLSPLAANAIVMDTSSCWFLHPEQSDEVHVTFKFQAELLVFSPAAHNVSSKPGLKGFFSHFFVSFFHGEAALATGRFKLISLKSRGRESSTDVWQTSKMV